MSSGASVAILIALWFRENKYGKKLSEDVAESFFFVWFSELLDFEFLTPLSEAW